MDKLKFALLNICIPVAVSIFVFIGIYTNGFCSALENINASSSAFEVIQGGANKGNGFYYSLTPEMYGTLGPMAFDELNAELYSKYGWDFETIAIDGADGWTNEVDPQIATQFGYQVTGQTIGNLAQTLIYKISTGLGKMFGLGQKTGDTLTVVHDGSVYYVDENTISRVKSTRNDLINNGDFTAITSDNAIYSKSIDLKGVRSSNLGSRSTLVLRGEFSVPVAYFTTQVMNYSVYELWVLVPYSALVGDGQGNYNLPFKGIRVNGNGNVIELNSVTFAPNNETFNINGLEYWLGHIEASSGYVGSVYPFGTKGQALVLVENHSGNESSAIFYKYSNESAMDEILSQLEGKYVTSTDMQRIIDAINNLQYGLITDNGNTLPVIDTNAEFLSNLQGIINQILANEQTLADVLNRYNTEPDPEPNPEPNPVENINQGIDVPTGFDNSILNPFLDIIKLPFKFFTIFSPVFAIFGSNALLSLWLFVPSFFIIMIIIWCLK